MSTPEHALHPNALHVLASTPAVLRSLLATLPDSSLSQSLSDEWSAKDVVAHLLSISRKASLARVCLMLDEDDPQIPNVDEEATLVASGMRELPLERLLDAFADERAERMQMLGALTPAQLRRRGRHESVGAISVADVVNHVAYHDLLHIQQIVGILAVPIEQRRGAMRAF